VFTFVSASNPPSPAEARAALAAGEVSLRYVPPEAAVAAVPYRRGQALVGALVSPGQAAHPVVFTGEPDGDYLAVSRSFTQRGAGGEVLTVENDLVEDYLEREPIVIDNDYLEWDSFPAVASFSAGALPDQFRQIRAGAVRSQNLSDSLYWGKGGTGVRQVKIVTSETHAYLMVEARNALTRGLSYLLYGYEGRRQSRASFTLEVALTDGTSGFVFLWLPGRDTPHIVGEFVYEPFFLEGRVDLSRVPAALSDVTVEELSFDFGSSFSGARVTEEFFYTTVYARDIVYRSPTGL
jgi:hypothetical protein